MQLFREEYLRQYVKMMKGLLVRELQTAPRDSWYGDFSGPSVPEADNWNHLTSPATSFLLQPLCLIWLQGQGNTTMGSTVVWLCPKSPLRLTQFSPYISSNWLIYWVVCDQVPACHPNSRNISPILCLHLWLPSSLPDSLSNQLVVWAWAILVET